MSKQITVRSLSREFLGPVFIFLLLFCPALVSAGPYSDSAHGNSSYGVNRLGETNVQGNCRHCHEQHTGAAGGLLLADSFSGVTANPYTADDNVCFLCHRSVGSVQSGGINNNDYSATFGGSSASTTGIMAAFNQNSYHNLYDLRQYITGASGTKSFPSFPQGTSPCSGCHNVHLAKANKRYPGDPTYTAISRPSDHESLWGDDSPAERMTFLGTAYQPPNYVGGNLEPDGASAIQATQAAKTPYYDALCIDCHNSSNLIYSTALGRNLRTFNWSLETHGEGPAADWVGTTEMQPPYAELSLGSYVLSCMDCHEPHGSSNIYLIRPSVNAGSLTLLSTADWDQLCSRCHVAATDLRNFHHKVRGEAGYDCIDCHLTANEKDGVKECITCHYHGSSAGGLKTF